MDKRILEFLDWVGRLQTVSAIIEIVTPREWIIAGVLALSTGTAVLNMGNTWMVAFLSTVGAVALVLAVVLGIAAIRGRFTSTKAGLIDMDAAIQTAIDKTHNTVSFEMSKRGHDPVTYYAYAIWSNDVKLFGCRPPSRTQVEVPNSKRGQFRFFKHDGRMVISYIAEDKPEYVDLKVSADDLEKRIAELIALDDALK